MRFDDSITDRLENLNCEGSKALTTSIFGGNLFRPVVYYAQLISVTRGRSADFRLIDGH